LLCAYVLHARNANLLFFLDFSTEFLRNNLHCADHS